MIQTPVTRWLTVDERMTEVARLLASGILRRMNRELNRETTRAGNDGDSFSDFGLAVSVEKSVHWQQTASEGRERSRKRNTRGVDEDE